MNLRAVLAKGYTPLPKDTDWGLWIVSPIAYNEIPSVWDLLTVSMDRRTKLSDQKLFLCSYWYAIIVLR